MEVIADFSHWTTFFSQCIRFYSLLFESIFSRKHKVRVIENVSTIRILPYLRWTAHDGGNAD